MATSVSPKPAQVLTLTHGSIQDQGLNRSTLIVSSPVTTSVSSPDTITLARYPYLKSINMGFCNWSGSAELAVDPLWSMLVNVKKPCGSVLVRIGSEPSAPASAGEGGLSIPEINPETKTGSVSLEARHYFDVDGAARRGFVSARVGTSKNIGVALGLSLADKHDHGGLSVHVGAYTNLARPQEIKPTLGISFAWSSF